MRAIFKAILLTIGEWYIKLLNNKLVITNKTSFNLSISYESNIIYSYWLGG